MNLTEIRKQKHITMIDLATQLGISQGHLSNLENGKRPIDQELINKIASILGEPVDTVANAAQPQKVEDTKLRSWLSSIRINGLPLSKAFTYHLEISGNKETVLKDEAMLKQELRKFIEDNIAYSVVAEITENKNIVPTLRMYIAKKDNNHEQHKGS